MSQCHICDNKIICGIKGTNCMNSHTICICCYKECMRNTCCFCRRDISIVEIVDSSFKVCAMTNADLYNTPLFYDIIQDNYINFDYRIIYTEKINRIVYMLLLSFIVLIYYMTMFYAKETTVVCNNAACYYRDDTIVLKLNVTLLVVMYITIQYNIHLQLYNVYDKFNVFKYRLINSNSV